MSGPLSGLRVVEIASIGPGPFCGMLLADMGADVIRVDPARAGEAAPARGDRIMTRGRRSIAVDLKAPGGTDVVLGLIDRADALLEGFRPGVMERLGLGPDICLGRNARLVYVRVTGWGQDGPYRHMAGHDINYLALTGALAAMGRAGEPPPPPLNLISDYGGGGMLALFGLLCALFERQRSGQGQVVDAAMVDGTAILTTVFHGLRAGGQWRDERGTNFLDGGAPYYDTYETADGRYLAIGAIEPQFYGDLLRILGLAAEALPDQEDRSHWPALKERIGRTFLTRTLDEWCTLMEGTDVCFAPVLTFEEAPRAPHNVARGTYVDVDGVAQPAPAPRLSRTPGAVARPPARPGGDTDELLAEAGFAAERIAELYKAGAVARGTDPGDGTVAGAQEGTGGR